MSELVTLRGLMGLPTDPAALSASALVLVDCQNTYRRGIMELTGVEPALAQCRDLLERARMLKVPVFHIRHDAGAGTPYDVNAEIGAIADEVAPQGNEPVVTKNYPNSFLHTSLHEQLQAAGAKNLVIAGFMTHMCISSTARAGFDLGYACTVVGGATATRPLPIAGGESVPAEQVQASTLAAIADLFAVVVPDQSAIAD